MSTGLEKYEYLESQGFEKTASAPDQDEALGRLAFKQYEFIKTAASANLFAEGLVCLERRKFSQRCKRKKCKAI
jgi:hypothetical protein